MSMHRRDEKTYKILVEKSEEKISWGRRRSRFGDIIETGLKEICGKLWTGCIWLRI